MTVIDKKSIRAELLQERAKLSPDTVRESSSMIMELIRTLFEWKNATEVLIYWPIKGEVDLRPLVTELWQRGCRVLLPRCRPDAIGEMDLACATCEDELVPGPFSLMEPDAHKCPAVQECHPGVALIPGVGFDRRGNRMGFGNGYYDRLLATESMRDTLKVGVAYDFQLLERIPIHPWDMAMDVICTEKELWRP